MKGKSGKSNSTVGKSNSAKQLIRKKELENSALKKILDYLEKESCERKPKKQIKKEDKSFQ